MEQNIETTIESNTILFFDMDGTLVETDFANYLSYKKAIQSIVQTDVNFEYNPNERFNRGLLKKTVPNLTEDDYENIVQRKEEYYEEHLSHTELCKQSIDILMRYFKTNKTVLVTNCRRDRALMTLNYHQLTDKFSNLYFRIISDDNRKINKFQNAISGLGISPKLVIAYENEESEIADAIEAGIQYINPIIQTDK